MAMDPTNPEARSMVAQLLAEAAETQGLDSKYVHIGGDEVKFDFSIENEGSYLEKESSSLEK